MTETIQNLTYYIRYQDIVKENTKAYYEKNKEKIKEKQREKYKQMTPHEIKNLVLKQKEWYEKLSDEKKDELKQRRKEQAKTRYYNNIIVVKQAGM